MSEIILTEEQKEKYEAIRWLLADGPRAQGKSLLMAMAFIDRAGSRLGEWVPIFDHFRHHHATKFLINTIMAVFNSKESIKTYRLEVRLSDFCIRMVPREDEVLRERITKF